ncbi:hypothetical protein GCM10007886_04010 [Methylobacterium gregans]|nr:hypothetical protein GCM10007886_04010 [Methylobacterium gregans]
MTDSADIQTAATRFLAEKLNVGWCHCNEFDDRQTHATVRGDFHRDGLPSMAGVHDLSGERDFLDLVLSGARLSSKQRARRLPHSNATKSLSLVCYAHS